AVHLHDLTGELHLRPAMITDSDLEDPARPDGEKVWVVGVVVDDAPLRSQHLDPVHHAAPASLGPPVSAALPAPGQPATARFGDRTRSTPATVRMAGSRAAAVRVVRITITSGHESFLHDALSSGRCRSGAV